jgi:hypothetical protein
MGPGGLLTRARIGALLSHALIAFAALLSGCGGSKDSEQGVLPAPEVEPAPSSSIGDVGGGQSGSEGEGQLPNDTSEIVEDGEVARSFLELGRLGPARIVRPLLQWYGQRADGEPPEIALLYGPQLSETLYFMLELPYAGGEAEYELPNEGGMYLLEGARTNEEKVGIAGSIRVQPTSEGLRVDFESIVVRAPDGTEEPLGDGVITGELERRCFELKVLPDTPLLDGKPVPQLVQDTTWSSAFCAQYR